MQTKNKNLSLIFDSKRKEHNYKKLEIAEKLGVHPNTIKNKIKNPLTFTLEELLTLKEIFNTETIEEIFLLEKDT